MKSNLLTLLMLLLAVQMMFAQKEPKIIKATSTRVDIKEDNHLRKNVWRILPEANPDIYKTSAKNVTFYTDVDSISFNVDPHQKYDFIILLNGKDTARTQIAWQLSKLDVLKQGAAYNPADNRSVPLFTYQSMDDPKLVQTRMDLKLDSIAGDGNELSQIFNLLHWVHDIVRHDGNSYNPEIKNAVELIKICKAEGRGVNCRMMATILNECYLAMGIKSRYITCMPKETNFNDCHVINMVYSTELKKWIWVDPTFDAYVMDGEGNLLGIKEVRERLIKDLPLVLNADANWNRTNLQSKDYYLKYYMAKNLYRLETPIASKYDTETWKDGKIASYVELLPLDGLVQAPQHKQVSNKDTGVRFEYYKTNNPDLFWTKPE